MKRSSPSGGWPRRAHSCVAPIADAIRAALRWEAFLDAIVSPAIYECRHCQDAGFVKTKLKIINFEGSQNLQPCPSCRPPRPVGVPVLRQSNTFASFDLAKNPNMEQAVKRCRAVVRNEVWCAVLLGTPGNGKTHLAIAALNELTEGSFWKVADLMQHIQQEAFSKDRGLPAVLEAVCLEPPLLVLDDMGTQKTTDWVGQTLYQILDARYEEQALTIITSNRPFAELDPRLQSRYAEGVVICKGSDVRREAMNGEAAMV